MKRYGATVWLATDLTKWEREQVATLLSGVAADMLKEPKGSPIYIEIEAEEGYYKR